MQEKITELLNEHREKGYFMYDESCFCRDVEEYLNDQTASAEPQLEQTGDTCPAFCNDGWFEDGVSG